MNRLTLAAALLACLPPRAADSRLNLLFIVPDDLNAGFASYGHPLVKTPRLDRLAATGGRLDRACCNHPCAAPRARPDGARVKFQRKNPGADFLLAMIYERFIFMRDLMDNEESTAGVSANGALDASPGQRPGKMMKYVESPERAA